MKLALEAAEQHYRELRALFENAMAQEIPLSADDLALMALNPLGRALLGNLLVRVEGTVGRPLLEEWLLETLGGDLLRFSGPAVVVHPIELDRAGTLEHWDRWLNRAPIKQPFKQIRRELFFPNANDRAAGTFSDRFAGSVVSWDQSRALLEGRGWYRVTKSGAEHIFARAGLTAHVEFRTPATPGFSREDVVINRIFFLPRGEQVQNQRNPGMPVGEVPPRLFSETLRDVGLIAQVARREPGGF
jgi:hypothetical protein